MANQLIYQGRNSKVFVEDHEEFGKVIVKYLTEEYPPPGIIKQFFNEFEILQGLNIHGVRKSLQWTKSQNKYTIYLEHIDGITIKQYAQTKPPLKNLLLVIRSVVNTLKELHEQNIIHKDITSANIIVLQDQFDTRLIDFEISTKLNLKMQHLGNPLKLEGTLPFMSPEQTGRMNRVVDHRSDLYSLGVVMYEVFTAQLPFELDDALELVHAHIATVPQRVHKLNPEIPEVISDIVAKLLEKNAEERYQSAGGLLKDIEICIQSIEEKGKIQSFEIGQYDITDRFQLVQKLYGRDNEIEILLNSFDGVGKGPSQLMLVSGYSGTGKSALVAEIHKPITEKRGYFIHGKFDQFQRGVPYYAILQAFNSYINLLLTEDEEKLKDIKDEIQQAVGEEAQVLIDVLPHLELVIGSQPVVPEVSGPDARNRFNYVFHKFLKVISSTDHPLVLFIDDLQWADSSSLELLNFLLTDESNEFFLCICAYRDNEVDAAHPFIVMVEELQEKGIEVSEIHLSNLKLEDVHQLVSDSVKLEVFETEELAQLVFEKTQGNAFFVNQFLKSLYEESLLNFDSRNGRWTWKLDRIKSMNITDNVVEFMAEKIKKIDPNTQEILISAASVGNVFDLKTLSIIQGIGEEQLKRSLQKPLEEGWILIIEDHYKFSHDRIQQAVYSLLSEEKRIRLHLEIGRHMLEKFKGPELEEKLFDVVNQLNWGIDLIEDKHERFKLCELNFDASKKARESSAFDEAYKFVQYGIKLLPEDPWKVQYELCLNLHSEASETAFLVADFIPMNEYIDQVIEHAKDLINKVKVYEIRINFYKAENNIKDALSTGFEVLAQLGERFPKKASMLHVMPELLKTSFMLRNKSEEDILTIPDIQNQHKKAAMRILANIAPSAYWGHPPFFPIIIFRIIQLSLKYGMSPVSAFGIGTYGVIQIGVLGRSDVGSKYGKIGLKILDRFDAKEWISQVYCAIYGLIFIWSDHVKHTLKPLLESYHIGMETGSIEFACINSNLYCINAFLIGKRLDKLETEVSAYSRLFAQYKQEINFIYNEIYRQAMHNFMGKSEDPIKLVGEAIDEEKMFDDNIEEKNRTGTYFIYFVRIMLANYFGEERYAWENIQKAHPLLDAVLAKLELGTYAFNAGLAAAAYYPIASRKEKRKARKLLNSGIKKLSKWAKHAPQNFLHKVYLLEAEKARLDKKHGKSRRLYDLSIQHAAENEYLHEEALANELAGRFHLEEGNEILAGFYLKNAYQAYMYWGANAKLKHLAEKYPNFISGNKSSESLEMSEVATRSQLSGAGVSLDLHTILKASTALSREIVLSKLLKELMHIVSENVGANRALLLLDQNKKLFVEAVLKDGDTDEAMLLQSIPAQGSELVPYSVIKFIQRTKRNVIMSNALEDTTFAKDTYIKKNKPKSIIANPILNKGEFIGILYLENNLTEGAFTEDSVHLINLLSGQIAVSIENARLYESLELKVKERTAELAEEKKKSDDLLLNILPRETAEELKQFGKARSRKYEAVTVMFTDFKNFTQIGESLTPEDLVSQIDSYFERFDQITEKYGIEKIKTIGDAYMAVSGLPLVTKDHALKSVLASIEIRDFIVQDAKSLRKENRKAFEIRIGLNSGPVVSGVVGLHKFAFDVWGDTVNTASRMESHSETSKINISGSTYELVKDYINCTYRGKIEAKNKGEIDMYYVDSIKDPNLLSKKYGT